MGGGAGPVGAGAGTLAAAGLPRSEPKISRGENYKGLPWVMLDYPRVFGKEDVFAIRTMFWWGHAFSVTLHLKGEWKRLFLPVIIDRKDAFAAAGFQWGVMEDEWEHGHTGDNYRPMGELEDGPGWRWRAPSSNYRARSRWNPGRRRRKCLRHCLFPC